MSPALYTILFLSLGIILIGIEITLVPGFGIIGVIGAGVIIYSVYVAWVTFGAFWGMVCLLVSGALTWLTVYLFMRSPLAHRLVLKHEQDGQPSDLPGQAEDLVGKSGIATTDLRPAGIVTLDGRRLDVVSDDGLYIESGTSVTIVRIAQNSIIVTSTKDYEELT